MGYGRASDTAWATAKRALSTYTNAHDDDDDHQTTASSFASLAAENKHPLMTFVRQS